VERKGHEKVLKALLSLPKLHYDIVGDGEEKKRLEKRIIELGLHERVKIHSNVSDNQLPKMYAAADIFVMPTTKTKIDREGFGIVYLEAAAYGLPVIATNHPGVDEAVIDKITGLLIEDRPEALLAAIDKLASDPGGREKMGKAGVRFVTKGFSREAQVSKLESLLKVDSILSEDIVESKDLLHPL
jgi:phosphatidylinositol alpha-1,6-mannosyltransferase